MIITRHCDDVTMVNQLLRASAGAHRPVRPAGAAGNAVHVCVPVTRSRVKRVSERIPA